jgi:hypothetical protein
MQYGSLPEAAVVYVGFNPSFSESGWKTVCRHEGAPAFPKLEALFRWSPEVTDGELELMASFEHWAHQALPYFRFHREFASMTGLPWVQLDLFAMRGKVQAEMRGLVLQWDRKLRRSVLTNFGREQLQVFSDALQLVKPKAVVVINALAADVLVQECGDRIQWRGDLGFYKLRLDSAEKSSPVPLLMSGMLTGQRPLDRFSRDRLFWQLGAHLGFKGWMPHHRQVGSE